MYVISLTQRDGSCRRLRVGHASRRFMSTGNERVAAPVGHLYALGAGFASGLTKVHLRHVPTIFIHSVQVAVGHGFDTVKTRVQLNPVFRNESAVHVLMTTIRREGFAALYKGATPPAVGWAAIDSVSS